MENALKEINTTSFNKNISLKIISLIFLIISIIISTLVIIFSCLKNNKVLIVTTSIFAFMNIAFNTFNFIINLINNPAKKSYIINLKLNDIFYNLLLTSFSIIFFISFKQFALSWIFFGISFTLSLYTMLITSIWTSSPTIVKYISNIIITTLNMIYTFISLKLINFNLTLNLLLYIIIYLKEILNIIFNFNLNFKFQKLKIIYNAILYIELTFIYIILFITI